MKQFKLILIVILMSSINGISQDFGIRGGLNIANQTGDITDNTTKIGFQFGPTVDFAVSNNVDFSLGLLYSTKGAKQVSDDNSLSLGYLDIPLLFQYNISSGFYAELGPYLSYILSASSFGVDIKDLYNTLDYGLLIGLGYDFDTIRMDARYGLGLANTVDNASLGAGSNFDIQNSVITIGATYSF